MNIGEHIYYKAVAVVYRNSVPRYFSVFDGTTEYAIGKAASPAGGCWVCPSIEAVALHAAKLPVRSALLDQQRVILRVAGWTTGSAPQWPEGHAPNEHKLLVSHIRPIEALPYERLVAAAGQLAASPALRLSLPETMKLPDIVRGFEDAFPRLSLMLQCCSGHLAVSCGQHSYDAEAWLTFHAFGSPLSLAPIVVRVLRDRSTPYSLAAALCDVEACLQWMLRSGGPCELVLTATTSQYWAEAEMDAATLPASTVRSNDSPMFALIPVCAHLAHRRLRARSHPAARGPPCDE
jgi:hypothetical protein